MGSAVARVAPPATTSEEGRWLRLAVVSLQAVQKGSGLPDDWSPDAIKVAHRFVEHGQPTEDETDWVPPRLILVGDASQPPPSVDLTADLGGRLADLQQIGRAHAELQSLMRISYAVFCLKKKNKNNNKRHHQT